MVMPMTAAIAAAPSVWIIVFMEFLLRTRMRRPLNSHAAVWFQIIGCAIERVTRLKQLVPSSSSAAPGLCLETCLLSDRTRPHTG